MSISLLLSKQNPDGGWPYLSGKSRTEPTAYAIMALLGAGERGAAHSALQWIASAQRADGGLPPQPGVDESTWVTSLVTLLPPEHLGEFRHRRAVEWLMGESGRETSALYRLRQRLLGNPTPSEQKYSGWPWMPGAAAWVGPTALAILALEKEWRRTSAAPIRARVEEGRSFLLARMCEGGGWNHGSARPLGYDSRPYPETTGMALAGLRGTPPERLGRSIDVALRFLSESRSADATNWLRLGLLAHNQLPEGFEVPKGVACRTLAEVAVQVLVDGAQQGRGVFWA